MKEYESVIKLENIYKTLGYEIAYIKYDDYPICRTIKIWFSNGYNMADATFDTTNNLEYLEDGKEYTSEEFKMAYKIWNDKVKIKQAKKSKIKIIKQLEMQI